ncbi:MAG TPA: EAL domain-containing protein [Acidimicrobiales bacterium]|nr:EAL domain-containing protein [Acidimicrobiales bacterium]
MNPLPPTPGDSSLGLELATLIEHRRELLLVLDDDGRLSWLGPAAAQWFGPSAAGALLADLAHPEDAGELGVAMEQVAAGGSSVAETRCRLRDRSGTWHLLELSITDRRGRTGLAGLVCVARDVADRMELTARLIHRATHDTLTALPNRASLLDRLHEPFGPGESESIAVLYVDLDGFKAVNDSLGHAAGDRVLVAIADRLRRAVRPGDMVARLGGDEFVVVATGVTDGSVALDIAGRVVATLAQPVAVGGRTVTVSASVGAAVGRRERSMELLDEADQAMYHSKHGGRDRSTLYNREMTAPDRRSRSEALLASALDRDGVLVLYQPVVELGYSRLAGVDALLRLRAPEGEPDSAGEFLDVAEETGLSVAVGAGLLDLACQQLARWRDELGPDAVPSVGITVSARQLAEERASDRVAAILESHGLQPPALRLQLPESSLVDADSTMARSLQKLRSLGVRLAVDDFGVGRSSLPYLRRYGIDVLRIDQGFINGLHRGGDDVEVVRAILGLAETLGLVVEAKGVERAEQAELLAELDCPLAQGPYFGSPGPPEALVLPGA